MNDRPVNASVRQDLSRADREELLAFIEKRNWFESKLESLKSLAPVYPFVHPVLIPDPHSTAGYVRAGADKSPWRLPDKAQLSAWISERNAIEDEVDRFDDGDMERMKEKTRQITRIPLTQPSTDLVEVTLDLILLIDQLLMVLRKRGAVLDLTALRLQWDDLRHEVSRESESVKSEIDYVVAEAQAWTPGAASPDRRSSPRHYATVPRRRLLSSSSNSSIPDIALGSPPSPSVSRLPPSPRGGPSSPSKSGGGRKSSLHLSILRSQLVGLQTRQRNFANTLVKRSSSILDRMIDQAARLSGLGGIDGPLGDDQPQGAVPDLMIELQEEIEENAKGISERVSWCSEFEAQARQAHAHYTSSHRAQCAATEVLAEMESALAEPASSHTHALLAQRYADASALLPPTIDDAFPRPSHPAFPSKDEHNVDLVAGLTSARGAAESDINTVAKALAFYSSILKARESLLAQQNRVRALRHQLADAVQRLEQGTAGAPRPSLADAVRDGGSFSGWLQGVHEWLDNGNTMVRSATDTHEATTLAVMQYRKALLGAPMAINHLVPPAGVPDDLGSVVDDDSADLVALARRCNELAQRTKIDAEALPLVLVIREDRQDIAGELDTVHDMLIQAANSAAWTPHASGQLPADLDSQISKIAESLETTEMDVTRLSQLLGSSSDIAAPLINGLEDNRCRLETIRAELDTVYSVSEQADAVRLVRGEAEDLIGSINDTRTSVTGAAASSSELDTAKRTIAEFKVRVEEWTDGLVKRIRFVSNDETPRYATPDRQSPGGPLTPPLTPVPSGPDHSFQDVSTFPDLNALDARVRTEMNHQSARVSAALANLVSSAEEVAFQHWSAPVIEATASLTSASDSLRDILTGLDARIETAKEAHGEPRRDLALDIQRAGTGSLTAMADNVQAHVTALNKALGAHTSARIDTHHAATIFSSADIAREAGLARLAEAQKWQHDVDQLVSDATAEVERQAQEALRAKEKTRPTTPKQPDRASKVFVDSLTKSLDQLDLEDIVHPTPQSLKKTPKNRRLPSSSVAKQLVSTFRAISKSTRSLAKVTPHSPEVNRLLDRVTKQGALVPELDELAVVSDAATQCDAAFSRLLEAIDSDGHKSTTDKLERDAALAVAAFERAAEARRRDPRVAGERERVMRAWTELRSMADNESMPPSSVASVFPSMSALDSDVTGVSNTSAMSSATISVSVLARSVRPNDNDPKGKGKAPIRRSASTNALNAALRSTPAAKAPALATTAEPPKRTTSTRVTSAPNRTRTASSTLAQPVTAPRISPRRPRPSADSVFTVPRTPNPRPSLDSGGFAVPRPPKPKSSRASFPLSMTKPMTPTVPQPFRLSSSTSSSSLSRSASLRSRSDSLSRSASGSLTRSASSTLADYVSPTRRNRLSSSTSSLGRTPRTSIVTKQKGYIPQNTSRLDAAVARVINGLDVDVPIIPAGRESPDDWKDESGRYWIGTGPRARLCFCRILRSRTVMVRVGGGWVELGRYLLDRCADQLEGAELEPNSPEWRTVPLAITSATLAASQTLSASTSTSPQSKSPKTQLRSLGSLGEPRTPVRSVSADTGLGLSVRPRRERERSPLASSAFNASPSTPLSNISPASVGAGSPLVGVSFIRRASESPSVRERERERERMRASALFSGSSHVV